MCVRVRVRACFAWVHARMGCIVPLLTSCCGARAKFGGVVLIRFVVRLSTLATGAGQPCDIESPVLHCDEARFDGARYHVSVQAKVRDDGVLQYRYERRCDVVGRVRGSRACSCRSPYFIISSHSYTRARTVPCLLFGLTAHRSFSQHVLYCTGTTNIHT